MENRKYQHAYSLVVEFENSADTGKTLAMILLGLELLKLGYTPHEMHGNFPLNLMGYNQYDNEGIRQYIRKLLREGIRHQIIMVDEIDSVFPSRFFKDRQQTEDLLKLNQMTKTENWFMFTRHKGTSIDKIIRDCTQISIRPVYVEEEDAVVLEILNAVDCYYTPYFKEIRKASRAFKLYDRWFPIT